MILRSLFEHIPAVLRQGSWDDDITSITANSKNVKKGSLFICIQGMEQDGHQYIGEAIERGATACLVNENFWQQKTGKTSDGVSNKSDRVNNKKEAEGNILRNNISEDSILMEDNKVVFPNIALITVKDTREAAAEVAAAFYRYPSEALTVIGITGTKGKTSITFMIRDILERAGYKTGLLGTIDYEIGSEKRTASRTTPEAIDIQRYLREMADCGCRFAVMEVSSQGLKLHRADAITFDAGVFTNLGKDHIGPREHRDMAEYAACKSLLFQKCRWGFGNLDDPYYLEIFKEASCHIVSYSCRQKADVQASDMMLVNRNGKLGTFFKVNGEEYAVSAPGEFSVYNAVAAVAVCRHYGIAPEIIREALRHVRVPGRVEVIENDRGYLLLIDYAHNAMSLKNVLETMRRYHPRQLWVLFGCGGGRSLERRREMGRVAGKYADFTVITSDNPRYENPKTIMQEIEAGMKETTGQYRMIEDRKTAIRFLLKNAGAGDILILAGKGHEQYQEVKEEYRPFDERKIVREILGELE